METVAFAKLLGDNNFVHYVTTENVTLGRQAGAADIVLGDNKNISRCHARITYNREKASFELQCMSKNGAFVDGEFIGPTNAATVLRSKALIQIGPRLIYFLLPKTNVAPLSGSDDDEGSATSRGAPQGIKISNTGTSVGKKWSRTSRERVRCALMRYGFGRWDALSEALDDRDYSLANLQLYASQLVQQLVENCDDASLRAGLLDILQSAPVELSSPESPEPSLAGWTSLQKNVKKWSTRLILLYELKVAMELFGEARLLDCVGPIKGRSLGGHWDRQEDLDLCAGIYRHGFGEFNAILNDETLCFKGKWAVRQDSKDGDEDDDAVSQTIADSVTKDVVMQDAQNESGVPSETIPDQHILPEWPQHLALIGRLKRILDLLRIKRGKHAASFKTGKKRKNLADFNSEDKKRAKPAKKLTAKKSSAKGDAIPGWTRKDQASFQRGIIASGKPEKWHYFRQAQPGLSSKSDEDLELYYSKFISAVDRVIVHTDAPEPEPSVAASIDEAFAFTFGVAVKIKERINLFQTLRDRLALDKEQISNNFPVPDVSFVDWSPNWSPKHDYGMLVGLLKYGLGSWPLIWADLELPFASANIPVPSDSKMLVKRVQQILAKINLELDVSAIKSKYAPRNPSQKTSEICTQPTYGPDGSPILPIQITSSLRLLSLGVVPPGRNARDGKHVFPIGFQSERDYPSLADPSHRCKYLCEIISVNGQVNFRVTCAHLPDEPIVAEKPTLVWKQIETRLDTQRSTSRKRSTINGMEKFGLNHPLVTSLILDGSNSGANKPEASQLDNLAQASVEAFAVLEPSQSPSLNEAGPIHDSHNQMEVESYSLSGEDEDDEAGEDDDDDPESSDIDVESDSDESDDPAQSFSEL